MAMFPGPPDLPDKWKAGITGIAQQQLDTGKISPFLCHSSQLKIPGT